MSATSVSLREIDRARWERIIAILGAVWDLPENPARTELERLCGEDAALRAQVEVMLAGDRGATDLLSRSPLDMALEGEGAPDPDADS